MATDRQVEANRRNSTLSSGPKSTSGKCRSRGNGIRHGLATESVDLARADTPEFEMRRAEWGEEYRPVGSAAGWALDRAVAASFRIERCERALELQVEADRRGRKRGRR